MCISIERSQIGVFRKCSVISLGTEFETPSLDIISKKNVNFKSINLFQFKKS